MKTAKMTKLGILMAASLIVSYLETFIPLPPSLYGMKLGLANIVIVILLYEMGTKEALAVNVARILLSGFLFGNLSVIIYSMAGGLVSFFFMWLGKEKIKLHIFTVSILGGVFHNMGQLVVAALLLKTGTLVYYAPVLIGAGIASGLLIGILSKEMIKRLPKF